MSVDLGLYPIDTDSSDEDMFTENVWWEAADNLAFVNDEGGPEPEPPQKTPQAAVPVTAVHQSPPAAISTVTPASPENTKPEE